MKFSECAKVKRSQKRGHHWKAIVPFSIQHRWDRQKKGGGEFNINLGTCVLSASSLAAPEILVVYGFPLHSLINSKTHSWPEPSVPVEWMLLALVSAFDHMDNGRMDLQLHDFSEVICTSFHSESEQDAVSSPADARVTG